MTLLNDRAIRGRIARRQLGIHPWEPRLLQPASVDVRLDREFVAFDPAAGTGPIDPAADQSDRYERIRVDEDRALVLAPGAFVLGCTYETITLPADLAARVEGKSSLGRLGLAVHVTAGFIDPGWTGQITLELFNHAPAAIMLWPGMKIGQLCVFRLNDRADRPYGSRTTGSHYQGQHGPQPSRSHERFERWHADPAA